MPAQDGNNARWNDVLDMMDASMTKPHLTLGRYWTYSLRRDIMHLLFALSRYKFACKTFRFLKDVRLLEVGCSEAIGALMFDQQLDLKRYVGLDMDADATKWNIENLARDGMSFYNEDFCGSCESIKDEKFNAIVSLDVIEHIDPGREDDFIGNCARFLDTVGGIAVIGTPNVTMTPYASEPSRIAHVNLYDQKRLHSSCSRYFNDVFIYNMNDEVAHTGFDPMACYMFAVCCGAGR